jgi:hypothetical protein
MRRLFRRFLNFVMVMIIFLTFFLTPVRFWMVSVGGSTFALWTLSFWEYDYLYGYYFMLELFVIVLIFVTLGNLPAYGEYAHLFGPPTNAGAGLIILNTISFLLIVYYLLPVFI